MAKEVGTRGRKLVATDESTVIAEPLLDAVVVKDSQGDGGLADSASTNESNWGEILSEINYLLDQLVTSEEDPRWWGRRFSVYARGGNKILELLVVEIADLC